MDLGMESSAVSLDTCQQGERNAVCAQILNAERPGCTLSGQTLLSSLRTKICFSHSSALGDVVLGMSSFIFLQADFHVLVDAAVGVTYSHCLKQ